MFALIERFERVIIVALIAMMMLAILAGTVELGLLLTRRLVSSPFLLLGIEEMSDIFGSFFMILIGLELLESIKTYVTKEQLHVEIVFLVAMIAIARKVIILEIKHLAPASLLGIAAIIVSLAAGYFMVRKTQKPRSKAMGLENHPPDGPSAAAPEPEKPQAQDA